MTTMLQQSTATTVFHLQRQKDNPSKLCHDHSHRTVDPTALDPTSKSNRSRGSNMKIIDRASPPGLQKSRFRAAVA